MRIGVNCYLLSKEMGGLRQYFNLLFNELLDSDNKNSYFFFYFQHNKEEMELLNNDRWKECAILLNDQSEVYNHLDKIDLYFCPFGTICPRLLPVPCVVTLVDIQEKYYPQFFSKQDLWSREYNYVGSTKVASQVITISEFSKNSIAHHHRIPKEKIHVAYLAVDENRYYSYKQDKMKLGLPSRFIFYPANRWFHKNHDNLLKALLILKKEHNLKVDCVFTGFDYENGYPLNEKIKEYGLGNQIKVIGYVKNEEIKHIYKKAVMLCFPSLFEGFGMPLIEAMLAECPVVCSNVTSIPEVVGDATLTFDPRYPQDIANKIYTLWNDSELRKRLIISGKDQVKKYSVKKMAETHLSVFNRAIQTYSKNHYTYHKYIHEPLFKFKMYLKKKFIVYVY